MRFSAILTLFIFLPNVNSQKPREMLDKVKKFYLTPWPDLSCLPHGPRRGTGRLGPGNRIVEEDIRKYLKRNRQTPEQLLSSIGLESWYKLERLARACEKKLTVESIKKIRNKHQRFLCRKMCTLEKLNFLRSTWDSKNITLGDLTKAQQSIRELLTGPPTLFFNKFEVDVDLVAEVTAKYLFLQLQHGLFRNKADNRVNARCWENTPGDHFRYALEIKLDQFLIQNCIRGSHWHERLFPYSMYHVFEDAEVIIDKTLPLWPELYDVKNNLSNTMFHYHNQVCQEQYNFNRFKTLYAGDNVVQRCTKVCILAGMGLLEIDKIRDSAETFEKFFEANYTIKPKDDSYTNNLFREQLRKAMNIQNNASKDFYVFGSEGFYTLGKNVEKPLPCYAKEWEQVFPEVEQYFKRYQERKDEMKIIKTPAPSPAPQNKEKVGENNGTEEEKYGYEKNSPWPKPGKIFWPDFSCIKGWFDVENRDLSHPLANSKGAGAKLMKKVDDGCLMTSGLIEGDDSDRNRCHKLCMLENLSIVQKKEPKGAISLVDLDTFSDTLITILTDKGGFSSVHEMSVNMHPALAANKIWAIVKDKKCSDKSLEGLYTSIDNHLMEASTESCRQMKKEADWRKEYVTNNYSQYTANLDLSCYDAFYYKDIESGGGDMVPFNDAMTECIDLVEGRGISNDCRSLCIFSKMGLINWGYEGLSYFQLVSDSDDIEQSLGKFFTGKNVNKTLADFSSRITQKCDSILRSQSPHSSCMNMNVWEDCIEREMSCKYTGLFLKRGDLNHTHVEKFPDMSCRQGYSNTTDPRKGEGLLQKYRKICSYLTSYGYYTCQERCILEQIGILEGNSGNGTNSTFALNEVQEMTTNLNKILIDFSGFDTSEKIASNIEKHCGEFFPSEDDDYCGGYEWTQFIRCITSMMGCKAGAVFRTAWGEDSSTGDVM